METLHANYCKTFNNIHKANSILLHCVNLSDSKKNSNVNKKGTLIKIISFIVPKYSKFKKY